MLAAIRPDDWNLPLLVHVAGAMLLVGTLVVVAVTMGAAVRRGDDTAALTRLGFRALVFGVLPAFVLMRAGAEWVASTEDVGEPGWIGIGYSTSDGGLLLTIIATVVAWRATQRGDEGAGGAQRAVAVLAVLLLVAYAVAVWAMTAKPD